MPPGNIKFQMLLMAKVVIKSAILMTSLSFPQFLQHNLKIHFNEARHSKILRPSATWFALSLSLSLSL